MRNSRNRILGLVASFLLSAAAVTAVGAPARAAALNVTNPGDQTSTTGAPVDVAIPATGGDGTQLTFTPTGLPPGFTISEPTAPGDFTADITGTFAAPFSGTVSVTVTDSTPADTTTVTFNWTATNKVTLPNPGPQTFAFGAPVTIPVPATDSGTGASAVITYAKTAGPAWLTIDPATGTLTGTPPTSGGPFTVTVTATDASGATANTTFTVTITSKVTVTAPKTETSAYGTKIAPVTVKAADTTPTATFTWSDNGTLPQGLAINTVTGVISGTPTGVGGTHPVTITATDNTGVKGTAVITWTVHNKVAVNPVAAQTIHPGTPYTLQLHATDSDPAQTTFTWKVVAPLPAGLKLNAKTGVISGTPTGYATVSSTFTATDAAGSVSATSAPVKFTATQPVQIFNPGKVVTTVGQGVSVIISMKNLISGEKTVSVTASGLPAGVTFVQSIGKPAKNGVLTAGFFYGWPMRSGTFKIIIRSKGSLGTAGWMTFPLVVQGTVTRNAPAGHIALLLGGKCLQDPGSRTAGGTRIVISDCVPGGTTENWLVASDGTIRINSRCLDIAGAGTSYAGQPLQLWRCNGAAREIFLQGTKGQLVNPVSGLCVTDPGASKRNGTVVRMGACRVKSSEQWTLPAQPVLASVGGKCADDKFSSMANGNIIDMFTCNNTISQAFSFMPDGTLRLFINKCVTVRNGKVALWACSKSGGGQRWAVVHVGGLASELTMNGVCLALPSLTAPDTTQLVTRACSATNPAVIWHIW